jgi:hypothetical protein
MNATTCRLALLWAALIVVWSTYPTFAQSVVEQLGGAAQGVVNTVTHPQDVVNTVRSATGDLVTITKKAAGDIVTTVKTAGGDTVTTVQRAGGDTVKTVEKAGGDIITTARTAGIDTVTTVHKAGNDTITTVQKAGGDTVTTVQKAGGDTITTARTAGIDTVTTVHKAGNDTVTTVQKAGGDTVTTVQKAGGDTITTARKAGIDTVTTVHRAGNDTITTVQKAGGDTATTVQRAGGDTITIARKAGIDTVTTVHKAGNDTITTVQKAGGDTITTVEKADGDIIATLDRAGIDTITTVQKAGNDTVTTVQKAGGDTVITIKKAGSDVVATYEKGWRDTAEQTQRSLEDVIDAGKAVGRFAERQVQDHLRSIDNAARRAREGKVVDALWGMAVEPAQASERNFGKATQESVIISVAAQAAATAYGGPAGAAAYAAWATYRATGDVNLALKAGLLSAATSYAGGSVSSLPSGTAGEVLKKAAVAGALGGLAVAAAGGDDRAVKDAFLKSGSAILVQGASAQLKAYSPKANNVLETVQCISARDVDCLSNTTYAKDAKGKILYDEKNQPRVDLTKLDPRQNIGDWTGINPNSAGGKQAEIMTRVGKLPQTEAIPIAHNTWVVTWTLGKTKALEHGVPAVVLTYVGREPPFYSKVRYKALPKAGPSDRIAATQ